MTVSGFAQAEAGPPRADDAPLDAPATLVSAARLGRVADLGAVRREHDPGLIDAFVDNMLRGDELAYAAWLSLLPLKGEGKQMFAAAVKHGAASVPSMPPEMKALFAAVDDIPGWVDWEQLRRGALAIWRGGNLVPICLAYSSVGFGFSSYGGTKALNFTRLLVDADRAGARLSETLRWFVAVTTPDGMQRRNAGFHYSLRVRMVHCAARYGVSRSPAWQWNEWGLPITNTDLYFTTSKVFCANLVEALTRLGVRYDQSEIDDIFALWRYIAQVMGVPEELNHRDMHDAIQKNAVVVAIERAPDAACQLLLHSLIGYTTEADGGYQALPGWLLDALGKRQKLALSYALIRYLTDDGFCEAMDVPRTSLLPLVRLLARLSGLAQRLRHIRGSDGERSVLKLLSTIREALDIEDDQAIASADEVRSAVERKSPVLSRSGMGTL